MKIRMDEGSLQVTFKGNKIKADSEYISNQCDHPTPLLTLIRVVQYCDIMNS